ncbi:MAG: 50S ribosomal protein L14e [archaeon GW2011_AR20]|nr:MAG: 50S ribosomal protein L14e [archaeon GW2011_AR20]
MFKLYQKRNNRKDKTMIGKICVKLTGREAGKACVIVNNLDDNFVLIDGNVKRRKCNIDHLEFTNKILPIKKDASTMDVLDAMNKAGIKTLKLKESRKEVKGKPRKSRKIKPDKTGSIAKNVKTKR